MKNNKIIKLSADEQVSLGIETKFSSRYAPIGMEGFKSPMGGAELTGGTAYTGAEVFTAAGKIVINSETLANAGKNISILFNHDPYYIIGKGGVKASSGQILSDYDLYDVEQANNANYFRMLRDGHPFQQSVFAMPGEILRVGQNPVMVNGSPFSNGLVYENTKIEEVSLCPVGADSDTKADVKGDYGRSFVSLSIDTPPKQETPKMDELQKLTTEIASLKAENAKLCACAEMDKEASKTLEQQLVEVRKQLSDLQSIHQKLEEDMKKTVDQTKLSMIESSGVQVPESLKPSLLSNDIDSIQKILDDMKVAVPEIKLSHSFKKPAYVEKDDQRAIDLDTARQANANGSPSQFSKRVEQIKSQGHTN